MLLGMCLEAGAIMLVITEALIYVQALSMGGQRAK